MRSTGDSRRDEARRLRVDEGYSRSQLMARFGVGNGTISEWIRGTEAPGWTRRPAAKDDLRERAVAMRRAGATVPEIAAALSVSKSSAYLWTRGMPLDGAPEEEAARRARHMEDMREARWGPHRRAHDATIGHRVAWVGEMTDREVLLCGAVAYWGDGAKVKPWHRGGRGLEMINSDPGLIHLFLRLAELLGRDRQEFAYRLSIHETADVAAATSWWAEAVGVPAGRFRRATLKTHKPSTPRKNVGEAYRGCLIVRVPRSGRLSWEIEGVVRGIAASDPRGGAVSM